MKAKVTFIQITGHVIAAFLVMALLSLFIFGKSRNFYDVRQINAIELLVQALIFALVLTLILYFRQELSYILGPLVICFIWLIYLVSFSLLAPVVHWLSERLCSRFPPSISVFMRDSRLEKASSPGKEPNSTG